MDSLVNGRHEKSPFAGSRRAGIIVNITIYIGRLPQQQDLLQQHIGGIDKRGIRNMTWNFWVLKKPFRAERL